MNIEQIVKDANDKAGDYMEQLIMENSIPLDENIPAETITAPVLVQQITLITKYIQEILKNSLEEFRSELLKEMNGSEK